jgi:hypothetical protein
MSRRSLAHFRVDGWTAQITSPMIYRVRTLQNGTDRPPGKDFMDAGPAKAEELKGKWIVEGGLSRRNPIMGSILKDLVEVDWLGG